MFRVRFLVSGSVQGVGYRLFVKRLAIMSKLNGYVRNMLDGIVEVVAEFQNKSDMDDFKNKLYKRAGSSFDGINVDDVSIAKQEEVEKPEFKSFEVRL